MCSARSAASCPSARRRSRPRLRLRGRCPSRRRRTARPSVGGSRSSDPPWYTSGSVQKDSGMVGAARLAHQLDVIDVGAAVDPVVGARQRRQHMLRHRTGRRRRGRLRGRARAVARARASTAAQSSSASCSVAAMPVANAARARSPETTASRPSRPPASDASFIFAGAFPAVDVARPLDRGAGAADLERVARIHHDRVFVGRRLRLHQHARQRLRVRAMREAAGMQRDHARDGCCRG